MMKRSKKYYLAAGSLISILGIVLVVSAKDTIKINAKLEENVYIRDNIDLGLSESIKSVSCQRTGGHTDIIYNAEEAKNTYFRCRENDTVVYSCNIKLKTLWGLFGATSDKKETFEIKCGTGNYSTKNDNYACRPCGNNQSASYSWVLGAPSNCGPAVSGVNSEAACNALNNNPNSAPSIVDDPTTPTTPSAPTTPASPSAPYEPAPTTSPSGRQLVIGDVAEEEDTSLRPPSRATNAATGACEDYVVTYEGQVKGIAVNSSHSIYKYYSAKSNCTDNQGQEFAAFCMDPTLIGPGGSAHGQTMPTSANYQITQYLDPHDSEFAKGAVYIYKKFIESGNSIESRCASEVAMRYLEFTVGGLEPRYSGPYSGDAARYASTSIGGSCGAAGLALYQEALAASVEEAAEGYGASAAEIIPNISQDDEGNVSGYLEVVGPDGGDVGITSVECPGTLTCEASGNRINVSGTLGCDEVTLKAAIGTTSDSEIKSVLLAEAANQSNVQRFILFQTGGPASAGVSYTFTPSDNCADENGCQTNVDFTCAPAGSYDNPIILTEGTKDGGETDWATCIYNNTDPKGNTYNAMKNDYCVVSCAEEWDFRLPGNIQTVSGRNFSFIARIGAKRTCKLVGDNSGYGVVTPVNYRRADGLNGQPSESNYTSYAKDHDYWAKIMVDSYNDYMRNYSIYRALQDYVEKHKGDRVTKADDTSNSCGESKYPEDKYDLSAETSKYFEAFTLDLTKSPYQYTFKYNYRTQSITRVNATDTTENIASNRDSETNSEDYVIPNGESYYENVDPTRPAGTGPQRLAYRDKNCTKSRTEYFAKSGNELYEQTIESYRSKAQTAYNKYKNALNKINDIKEMYDECTDWENEYEFEPEIRFTYQEESYMDLIMKHQNKNFLINRTELDPESPRSTALSLYDIDIAVGTPGTNLDYLTGSETSSASAEGFIPPSGGACTGSFGRTGSMDAVPHRGVDIRAGCGEPVVASKSGTAQASYHYSWGNYVKITHGDGTTTLYAHLQSTGVSGPVSQGQVIGYTGQTGNASGCHNHFEITVNGSLVDPAPILGLDCVSGAAPMDDHSAASMGNPDYGDFLTYGPDYPYITDAGFGGLGSVAMHTVKEATYGDAIVEYQAEETEYRSGVYFYTTNPDGLVTTTKDEGNPNQTELGYVYPVSLNTPQGNYPYTLDFGYIGMYNDSNELGRIMGASNSSLLSGSAADYVCHYNVCDPTVEDCPPQMCDEYTDKNGQTHYYDREGNETDKKTHDEQCSDLSKSCTWQTDENGNDTFCDKNGNCSSDPSAYLRDCAKECTGYSLVSYENYTGAEVENSGRLQFLPKVISLNSLFPASNQTAIALNWQNAKAQTVQKQIEEAGESIFANPQYEFELTPAAMANIREYNKTQLNSGGYADFTLTCNYNSSGKYGTNCHSNFLDTLASRGVTVIKRDSSFTSDDKGYSYK